MILQARTCSGAKWAATAATVSRRPRTAAPRKHAVIAKADTKFALAGDDGDISPGIAAGLFVAVKQGALQATAENLRTVIAIGALVLPVCNLIFRTNYQNRDLGMYAPAALAAEALNVLSIGPAAIAAFGISLCNALAGVLGFNGAYFALLGSLAVAVYYNMGAVWVACGLLASCGYQFFNEAKESNFLAAPAAMTLASGYALLRYFKDSCSSCVNELAFLIIMARVAWSLVGVARKVLAKETDA